MHQRWDNLLFLHWPIDPIALRGFIPASLDIDLFEGQAWIGITPFALNDLRIRGMPAIPGLSSFNELNVRTYVLYNGTPGIWFFSLDASKLVAAVAARLFFMLPYFRSDIQFQHDEQPFSFQLRRTLAPAAQFQARWHTGIRLRAPDTESLAFFLVERYCYFAADAGRIYQTRIYHAPWILDEAFLEACSSTLISVLGLHEPATEPMVHFARQQNVDIWAPVTV